MIKKEIFPSWQTKEDINDIHSTLSEGHFQFNHSFREGNIPADFLTNLAEHDKKTSCFTVAINLPRKITTTMNNDEKSRPNFRIKVKKSTFIFDLGGIIH